MTEGNFWARLRARLQDPLLRGTFTLSLGTLLGQLAPILALPVLGRFYSSGDFGLFALFVSAVNVTGQLACLKYDMAIPMAEGEEDAAALFGLSLLLSMGWGVALLPLIGFSGLLSTWFTPGRRAWIWLIPLATVFTGWYTALVNYNLRLGKYRDISTAGVVKSLAMVAAQLLLIPANLGGLGLVLGQLAAYLAGNLRLAGNLKGHLRQNWPGLSRLRSVGAGFGKFPRFTLPGALASSMVYSLTSYLLAVFYSPVQLGWYSMVNRMVFTPASMVSSALSQVFVKQASDSHHRGEPLHLFGRIVRGLLLLAIPGFGLLFLAAEPIVRLLLGEDWMPMVPILRLMLPLAAARFVVTPISATPIVLGKNSMTMGWQLALLGLALIPAAIAVWQGRRGMALPMVGYVGLLSAGLTLGYLALYRSSAKLVKTVGKEEGHSG